MDAVAVIATVGFYIVQTKSCTQEGDLHWWRTGQLVTIHEQEGKAGKSCLKHLLMYLRYFEVQYPFFLKYGIMFKMTCSTLFTILGYEFSLRRLDL